MIFVAFLKALAQIGDPRFRRVFFIGIALSFVLLIAATAGVLILIQWLTGDTTTLPLLGRFGGWTIF